MKLFMRGASFSAALLLFLLCCSGFAVKAEASPLFSVDEPEVVVFFSYHCGDCQVFHAYMSAWSHLNPNVKVKRVPVFGSENDGQWRFGARLFFLLEQARDKFPLSTFERQQAAFNLTQQLKSYPTTPLGFQAVLREYGLEFTNIEFIQWWRYSDVMMFSAEDILKEVNDETGGSRSPPFMRISVSEKSGPVYVFSDNPLIMIQEANGVIHAN